MPGPRQEQFIREIWPHAQMASAKTGVMPEIIVAQAALESGWGKSAPNNNYFGIKGPGGTQTTREYINGQWVTIQDSFRGYGSLAESVQGYADFITRNPRYGTLRVTPTFEGQVKALQESGYATDPNYGSKIKGIAETVRSVVGGASNLPQVAKDFEEDVKSTVDSVRQGVRTAVEKGKAVGKIIAGVATGNPIAIVDGISDLGGDSEEEGAFAKFFKWLREFFSVNTAARVVAVLVGVVLIAGAIWALVNDKGDVIVNTVTKAAKDAA